MAEPQYAASNPVKGVALIAAAVFLFALSDVLTKYLTSRHPVPLVIAMRYGVNMVLLALIFLPRHGRALFRTQRTGLVLLRAGVLAAASLTMGLALTLMPVGETLAITYLAPIGVILLAGPLLGEKVSKVAWIAAGLGFAGVLLIVRPGSGLVPLGVLLAFINAGLAVAYQMLSRVLSRTETTMALLFVTATVGFAVFALSLPWTLPGFAPSLTDLIWLLALGVLATGGHFLFTAAYREAPAQLLAPVNYLHLLWAGGLGYVVFQHIPDPISLAGMALVAVAGVTVALRGYFASRSPVPPPAT